MLSEGIHQIGDGLLEVAEERLRKLLVQDDINEIYDVEQTPFARGKFAAVRRAVHKKSGIHFAAKFLKRRRRAQSSDKEIKHEIAVLILCSGSDNIVQLNAVHETRSDTALLLELATGGELQALLDNEGSLTEGQTRICMREVLKALQFLHKRSIAHLDLKPQNILLTGKTVEDGLKLCDFGISRVIESGSKVREILGTPDYVAPEVLQYEPLSLQTDIWSVGVLTYVLLSGFSPFGGDTKQETFLNISQCALSFPDDLFQGISQHAIDFIKSTLRIKPNDRLTAFESLDHIWLKDESPLYRSSLKISTSVDNIASDETKNGILQNNSTTMLKATVPETTSSSTSSSSSSTSSSTESNGYHRRYADDFVHVNGRDTTTTTTISELSQSDTDNDKENFENSTTRNSLNKIINNLQSVTTIKSYTSCSNSLLRDEYISSNIRATTKSYNNKMVQQQQQRYGKHSETIESDVTTLSFETNNATIISDKFNKVTVIKTPLMPTEGTKNYSCCGATANITTAINSAINNSTTTTSSSNSSNSNSSNSNNCNNVTKVQFNCIFPDAPTTPKVVRKAPSSESPTSVKALVRRFQLESNETNSCIVNSSSINSNSILVEGTKKMMTTVNNLSPSPNAAQQEDDELLSSSPSAGVSNFLNTSSNSANSLSCGSPGCRHSGNSVVGNKSSSNLGLDQGIIC